MDKDTLALWQKRHTFTLGEATLLILGLSPDGFVIGEMLSQPTPERFKAIFGLMVVDAKEELRVSESQEYAGQYFTEYRLMTNNSQDDIQTRSENEWLMTEVSYGAIREWTELRGYPQVFDDDYVITDANLNSKTLLERERNSLYRIIYALVETSIDAHGKNKTELEHLRDQTSLIEYLCDEYQGHEGISTSNLGKIIPNAKKLF